MTRRQRWHLGHSLAYLPMLALGCYVGYVKTFTQEEVPGLVGPLAVLCCVFFFVGLMIRDAPPQKTEPTTKPDRNERAVILPIRHEGKI